MLITCKGRCARRHLQAARYLRSAWLQGASAARSGAAGEAAIQSNEVTPRPQSLRSARQAHISAAQRVCCRASVQAMPWSCCRAHGVKRAHWNSREVWLLGSRRLPAAMEPAIVTKAIARAFRNQYTQIQTSRPCRSSPFSLRLIQESSLATQLSLGCQTWPPQSRFRAHMTHQWCAPRCPRAGSA